MVVIEKCIRNLKKIAIFVMFSLHLCESKNEKDNETIYILQWTPSKTIPFPSMEHGNEAFLNKKCRFKNCFVTNDTKYLNDITEFEAILFNIVQLHTDVELKLPTKRCPHQKYILVSQESAENYALPKRYDGYFNWTWTHRIDSDISFEYITVKNKRGKVIGPKKDMHWIDINKMKPTSNYVMRKLRNKRYAAAWFVSNCETGSKREMFAENLGHELHKHGLKLDTYGSCGPMNCPRDGWEQECHSAIESDYYFYLAFENSFGEDYVTEKLLTALEHFAVPVVLGGANYTRFIPDGIYLDACALGPEKLARQMNNAIVVKQKYYEYFKWHSHYSFHSPTERPSTDPICKFCELLNNIKKRTTTSIHRNTSTWWNQSRAMYSLPTCRISLPEAAEQLSNHDETDSLMNSVKNEIVKVLPNIYHTIRDWMNKISSPYFCILFVYIPSSIHNTSH